MLEWLLLCFDMQNIRTERECTLFTIYIIKQGKKMDDILLDWKYFFHPFHKNFDYKNMATKSGLGRYNSSYFVIQLTNPLGSITNPVTSSFINSSTSGNLLVPSSKRFKLTVLLKKKKCCTYSTWINCHVGNKSSTKAYYYEITQTPGF